MSPKPCRESLRKPSSKRPRNPPRVPSAEPNTSPPGFFPSCHVSPNTPHREDLPRMSPEFAICLRVPAKTLPPGALRAATCPETPEYLPEARMRCVPECRVSFPRMPPVAPRAPSAPEPQTTRTPPGSPRITPEAPPGHSASAPRVDHPGSEFSVIYRKFQKMVVTSKIHRNSSLNRKNPKPIFTVSF